MNAIADPRSALAVLRELINADLDSFLAERIDLASHYDASVADVCEAIGAFVRPTGAQVSTFAAAASAGAGRPLDAATARLCTAIELYAYGVLVHDDILDRDDVRFGRPAFHTAFASRLGGATPAEARHYGASMALLGGAIMQALAMEAVLSLPLPPVQTAALARLLAAGYRRLTESQVVDVAFEHRLPKSEEWYAMAGQRAAEHLATTIGLGALLSGAPDGQRRTLEEFARALGYAYDIREDLRDAFGDESRMRSRAGRDLARSKKPLVLCIAAERAPAPARQRLAELLARVRRDPSVDADPADVAEILTLLVEHGFEPALDALDVRLTRAREMLDAAGLQEPWHSFLVLAVDACRASRDELVAGAGALSGRQAVK